MSVYFMQAADGLIKIGMTFRNPAVRAREVAAARQMPVIVLKTIPGTTTAETAIHTQFAAHRLRDPAGGWFKPNPDLLQFIEDATSEPPDETGGNIADALREAFGCQGDRELAALFNVSHKKPSDWRKQNWLPWKHRHTAELICIERGIPIPPELVDLSSQDTAA